MINRCMQCDAEYEGEDLGGLCPRCLSGPKEAGTPDLRETGAPVANRTRGLAQNIPILCSCGREFFVPATAQGHTRCPRCRSLIPITSSGQPVLPIPAQATEPTPPPKNNRTLMILIGAGGGVLGILLVLLILIITREPDPPDRPDRWRNRAGQGQDLPDEGGRPRTPPAVIVKSPGTETPPSPPPPTPPSPPIPGLSQKDLEQIVARANMTGLVSTLMLLNGRAAEHDDLHARLLEYEARIKEMVTAAAKKQRPLAPPAAYFQSGDRLFWFSGRKLDLQNPQPFAESLTSWLRTFQPGAKVQGDVQRGSVPVSISFYFPERSEDLLQLLKTAEKAVPVEPPAPEVGPLPSDLLAEVKGRLDALHPCYRKCIPPGDDQRMKSLMASGRGTEDDANFLRDRIVAGLCREFADEYSGFAIKLKDVEPRIIETPSADVVHFKDGRKLEGSIEEETEDQIKIKARFGSVRVPRGDIQKIERGKGTGLEFRSRYEAARDNPAALASLISWCKERKQDPQKELACYTLLLLDPGHPGARLEVGLSPNPGAPAPEAQVSSKEGKIEWNGVLCTPEELNRRLAAQGYIRINGLWHEKVSKVYRVDNLYRDEKKLILHPAGASIVLLTEEKEESSYDLRTRSYLKQVKLVPISRFIGKHGLKAGTARMTTSFGMDEPGVCYLEIQSPGEIVDGRVKAASQVLSAGGSVSISIAGSIGDTDVKVLYTLNAPGSNDATYDITDKIRGLNKFFIRAEVRRSGMFLPGDSKASGLLDVRYTYGKPLERINSILGLPKPADGTRAAPAATPIDNDLTEKAAAMSAEGAYTQFVLPIELMGEVRRLTGALRYSRDLPIPPRFSPIVSVIPDPLRTRFEELGPAAIQEIHKCWEGLTIPDRRDYLRFFGLWCARTRHLRETAPGPADR